MEYFFSGFPKNCDRKAGSSDSPNPGESAPVERLLAACYVSSYGPGRADAMPTTYINFHAPINQLTTQNLMTAISQKMAAGTTDFYILLSTPGGDVASGITVYNFLRGLPHPVTMHNVVM